MELFDISPALTVHIESGDIQIFAQGPRLGSRPRRIKFMEYIIDFPLQILVVLPLPYLIPHAPHEDAWMIAVPLDKFSQVLFPPIQKIVSIIVSGLAISLPLEPSVEKLVHHQEAHFVAQVIKLRREGVMSRPDSIAAHFLQDLQTPAEHIRIYGYPGRLIVLVHTDSLDEHFLAIQFEPIFGGELQSPETKRGVIIIHQDAIPVYLRHKRVHSGRVGRPE